MCLLAHIVRTDTCFMYLPGKAIFQITLSCAHSTFLFQCSYISSAFGLHCRQGNLVRKNCQISKIVPLGGRVGSVERPCLQLSDYQNTVNPFPHLTSTSSLSYCSSGLSWIMLATLSDENKYTEIDKPVINEWLWLIKFQFVKFCSKQTDNNLLNLTYKNDLTVFVWVKVRNWNLPTDS